MCKVMKWGGQSLAGFVVASTLIWADPVHAADWSGPAQGTWHEVNAQTDCKFFNLVGESSVTAAWSGQCEDALIQGGGEIILKTKHGEARLNGTFRDGVMQGKGTLSTWIDDGRNVRLLTYIGTFTDGRWDGVGELKIEDVLSYKGQFKHGRIEGLGEQNVYGKYQYIGSFLDEKFHGQGVLILPGNTVIEGEFSKGHPDGLCTMTQGDDFIFAGTLKGMSFNGHGTLTLNGAAGTTFEGDFRGPFNEPNLVGEATMVVRGEQGYRYEGFFSGMTIHGFGTMTFKNGGQYQGNFKAGVRHGNGTETLPNGHSCEGRWEGGVLIGHGVGKQHGRVVRCFMGGNGIAFETNSEEM